MTEQATEGHGTVHEKRGRARGRGRGVAAPSGPAEPVVRHAPRSLRSPLVVRRARIWAEDGELVVRDPRAREHRFPVGTGQGAIAKAVLRTPGNERETDRWRPVDRWGVLTLRTSDDRDVLCLRPAFWLPEAAQLMTAPLDARECLRRTGLQALLDRLGVPLEVSGGSLPSGARQDGPRNGPEPYRADYETYRERSLIKLTTWLVYVLAVLVALPAGRTWAVAVAVPALLALPVRDTVHRVRAWWHRRRPGPRGTVRIAPSPAPASGATRRFLRTASVRVEPADVVLVDTLGGERRLGREAPHGVRRLVRLMDPGTRKPLGVELRDGADACRALLPWDAWFGGPEGEERWTDLAKALRVPRADETYRGRRAEGRPWWLFHRLADDVVRFGPCTPERARSARGWYTTHGPDEPLVITAFSALCVPGLLAVENPAGLVIGVMAALTVALVLVPPTVATVFGHLVDDRPVAGKP